LPPHPPLFPYTTLFRSWTSGKAAPGGRTGRDVLAVRVSVFVQRGDRDTMKTMATTGSWRTRCQIVMIADSRKARCGVGPRHVSLDRKSTRLNSSHVKIA